MADTARNPDALQEEIERTREELTRTIDTIADRVSPKNAARRGAQQVRDNTATLRKRLPGGRQGDFHQQLAHRESEDTSGSTTAASESTITTAPLLATGGMLRSNRTFVLAGVGLLVVAVIAWRRTHN